MTALPPSNTRRWFLDYQTCGEQHTMVMRTDDTIGPAEASEAFGTFLDTLSPLLFNLVVVRLRECVEGSNISIPATFTGTTEYGSGAGDASAVPFFWSFTGKSPDGRLAKVQIFGMNATPNNNYRVQAVDDSVIDACIALLNTTDPVWLSISEQPVFWNTYANQGVNAYWQRQQRL